MTTSDCKPSELAAILRPAFSDYALSVDVNAIAVLSTDRVLDVMEELGIQTAYHQHNNGMILVMGVDPLLIKCKIHALAMYLDGVN